MEEVKNYSQLVPDISQWPINKLSVHRHAFVQEMNAYTLKKYQKKNPNDVEAILASTIYKEKLRIKKNPWKVDPRKEKEYWQKLEVELKNNNIKENRNELNIELVKKIINRYSEEIVGHFDPKTFKFARVFLSFFFRRIFLKAKCCVPFKLFGTKKTLLKKLHVQGDIEHVRELFDKGTVVFLPVHFSNLDSILIGYVADMKIGLPSFSYGAGLNLFNTEIVGYFINRLGAYKLDRRKKNDIYLENLKTYSSLSIQRGINSLFFPGGTRSRSGMLEKHVKLGLLNTLIEAQRHMLSENINKKIIVVPIITSYHSVLEASSLIENYLRESGKEKYLKGKKKQKKSSLFRTIIKDVYSSESEFYLNVGQAMDIFGNRLNSVGQSIDHKNNILNIRDYYEIDGKFQHNPQREKVYTKKLGQILVDRYHQESIVLTSQIVAFTFFSIFRQRNIKSDIYSILNLSLDDFFVEENEMYDIVNRCIELFQEEEENKKIILSDNVKSMSVQELIYDGIKYLSAYHVKKCIKKTKYNTYVSEDYKLLYYYHNRLVGYNVEDKLMHYIKKHSTPLK